jgi:hypothetical protein
MFGAETFETYEAHDIARVRSVRLPERYEEEEVEALSPKLPVADPAVFRGLVVTAKDWPPDSLLHAAQRTAQLSLSVSLQRPSQRTLSRSWDVIVVVARPGETRQALALIDTLRQNPMTAYTPVLLLDTHDAGVDYGRLARLGVRRCAVKSPGAVQAAMALHLCWSRPSVELEEQGA